MVLGFLLQYERVSEPQSELEVDRWIKKRGCTFPALATSRLPLFTLVTLSPKEKYRLLEREFNLDTYRAWIQVSKVLGLATDIMKSAILLSRTQCSLCWRRMLKMVWAYQQECLGELPDLHQHHDQQ
jgi:hypothetical protein